MTGFDDREKGFEKKFSQDQEAAFRAKARREGNRKGVNTEHEPG